MQDADMALRRRALEIVTQLPENAVEARMVLNYARELIDGFLAAQSPPGGSRPSLRAIAVDRSPIAPSSIHPVERPGI
jgi:hypothetical protein